MAPRPDMPDDDALADDESPSNGVHKPAGVNGDKNPLSLRKPNLYTDANHKWLPGNPGRPVGAKNKRKNALDLADDHQFNSLEQKIILAKQLAKALERDKFTTDYERIEYLKLYELTLRDLNQYTYQKLKAVETHTQIELVDKLRNLDGMSDAELDALLIEAQALAKQLPPGR